MRPIFYMFFRPEEIHTASGQTPGYFPGQTLGESDIHVSNGCFRVDFKNFFITQADLDRLTTIKATGVDLDFFPREEPAHGQRLKSSLTIPSLFALYSYQIMGGYIGKRRPGFNVIRVLYKPAGYGRFRCFMLDLPGFFGL